MFQPNYTLTNGIVQDLTRITECKTVIDRAKILPIVEIRLRHQALVRMTHSSTAIEGNKLNLAQVEEIVKGKKIEGPERDTYEVKNYLNALKFVDNSVKNKKQIGETTILKIHKLLTENTLPKEKSGIYRTQPVYVVRHIFGLNKQVVYTAPSAKIVKKLMTELVIWLTHQSENINPVIVAGVVHQEIAAIHPFADGNGRLARGLSTYVLYARGYDFRKLFALEDYYNQDREKYYTAIDIGKTYDERKRDMTNWLTYFVHGFKEEIENVGNKIQSLSLKNVNMHNNEKVFLDEDQQQIIDFLDKMGRIDSGDVCDILKIPKRTAQLKLLKLKNLGFIRQTGKGPSSAYVLNK